VEDAVRGGEGQQTSPGVPNQISRLRDPAQHSDPTNPNIDAVSENGQAHWAIPSGARGRNINLAPAPTTTKDETEPEVAPEVPEEQSAIATQAPVNAPPAFQEEQSAQEPSMTAIQSEPGTEVGDPTAPSSETDSTSNQSPGAPAPEEQAGVASDGAATATSEGATTEAPGSPGGTAASPAAGPSPAMADAGSQPEAESAPPEEEGAGGGAQEPGMAGPAGGETPPEGGDGAVGESGMVGGGGSAGTPEEDPSFQAMVGKTKSVSIQQQGHPPAEVASSAAQSAAVAPPTEVASKAQANQVGEMEQQPSGTFDKAAFKAALMQKIADMAPKNLEEADEFKGSGKLASVKSDLTTKVDQGKEQSQGPLEEKAAESPDTGAIEPKPVTPLQPHEPGAAPPEVGAAQAMPKPKPQEEVAAPFKQGSLELDQQMAEGEISEAQLANSNEPQFQEALQAKKGAQADAAKAPGQYRQGEQDVLAQAQADAAATAQTETSAMHGDRATLLTEVAGDQGQAKSQDEQARAEVASHIQGIYDKTQADVETRLASLDTEVDDAFKQGADQAQKAFEDYVDARMEDYKKERYSGVLGWGRWLKDKLVGMPPGVEQFYTQGRQLYIAQMDAVIDNVVNIVANGLAEAKSIVAQGKQEISQYVASLPQSLQEVGQETSANIQDKFEQLEQSVNNKQDELITSLVQSYQDSVGQVDAKIEKLKAANRGLVDKAIAAVAGTIGTILKLKDMLLGVLSKAAGVISFIINDPIGFLGNLVSGVKLGFNNFVAKIGGYLEKGMIGWLTGAVASAGIDMPEKLDPPGIFSMVMQILGLTYQNIRGMAVKILGESAVGFLETTFDVFKTLATEGIAGLWGFIQDKIGDLKTMVMDQIKDMLIGQVIKSGVKWILSMLNPAAAFIKACMAIYDIVKFFIERGSEMIGLVNAIVNSVGAVAKGNIAGAAKMVEESLGKAVPVAIGFLANLLGLGGIADKVRSIIETVQKPIKKAIGWVLGKAKAFAKKMGKKLGMGKDKDEGEGEGKGEAGSDAKTHAEVRTGREALSEQSKRYAVEGKISYEDAEKVAASVKKDHPVFKSIKVVDGQDSWDYDYKVDSQKATAGKSNNIQRTPVTQLENGGDTATSYALDESGTERIEGENQLQRSESVSSTINPEIIEAGGNEQAPRVSIQRVMHYGEDKSAVNLDPNGLTPEDKAKYIAIYADALDAIDLINNKNTEIAQSIDELTARIMDANAKGRDGVKEFEFQTQVLMTYLGGFSFDSNIVLKTAWLRAKEGIIANGNPANVNKWDNVNKAFRGQFDKLLKELAGEDAGLKKKVDAIKNSNYLNIHHMLLKGQDEFIDLQTERSNLLLVGRGNKKKSNTKVHEAIHRLTALIESKKESTEALEQEESVAMTDFSEMDSRMTAQIQKGQKRFRDRAKDVIKGLTGIFNRNK
jgi:hypothetical protein